MLLSDGLNKLRWMDSAEMPCKCCSVVHHQRSAINRCNSVVPTHGVPGKFDRAVMEIGYPYPDYGILDFKTGGPLCLD